MHRKNSQKIPIEPSTIGYMCKEFQSICSNYDGGMAYFEHAVLYSNKDYNIIIVYKEVGG